MHSVLVTGGAGYIGSHMVQALRRGGYRTVVLDDLSAGHAAAVGEAELVQEDMGDRGLMRALLRRHRPSAICHFAALARVDESMEQPLLYYKNNVLGTLNLLEAALEVGVARFVFSSSAAVYGEPQEVPITESHPTAPVNPYGRTKLVSERLLADCAQAYGIRFVALRYFNAAGADVPARLGEDHRPETHLIPLALKAAVFQDQELVIHGDNYDTPDGTCIRDYVHVIDLVDAHLRALEYLHENDGGSQILNLGTGAGNSVREVMDMVGKVTGVDVPHRVGPRRAGDPARLVASFAKAKDVLGWEPRRDLEEMVRSAYEFLRIRPEGYPSTPEGFGDFGRPRPESAEVE